MSTRTVTVPASNILVGTTDAQTLTGPKTLTAPVVADFTAAAHDHGDADDGGALVAAAIGLTTKGDLVTRDGTVIARLAVGAASTVLSADADETTGLLWMSSADWGYVTPISGRRVLPRVGQPLNFAAPFTMVADTLYGHPTWLRKGEVLSALSVEVTTGVAGAFCRVGLYAYDSTTGMGGARKWDAGTVDCGTTGIKDATSGANYTVTDTGFYVVVVGSDAAPVMRALGASASYQMGQTIGTAETALHTATSLLHHTIAWTAGADAVNALPDPLGAATLVNTATPLIALKIA